MNKQSSIGTRLKEWINTRGLTASDFAKQLQIQRSALSHIFSGRNKPSVDVLFKIKSTYPEMNLDWLITGVILEQIENENPKILKSGADTDLSKVTNVNIQNVDADIQDVNIDNEAKIKSRNKDRILVRIIELYSDGTFKHFDP